MSDKEFKQTDHELVVEQQSGDQRRKFLKQVVITGTGAITFVKSAGASTEGSLPGILSLLLEDEEEARPIGAATFNPTSEFEGQQFLQIPDDASFMEVDARGAGGGGAPSIAFENTQFIAGAKGGNGGRASAVFDLDRIFTQLVARVGTGGTSVGEGSSDGGFAGQFGGGDGGGVLLRNSTSQLDGGTRGSAGGGFAGIFSEGNPIILAGGGGGAAGGVSLGGNTFVGGTGGNGAAFDDADTRAGEDGNGNNTPGGFGGNRFLDGETSSRVSTSRSTGGLGALGNASRAGAAGVGTTGGNGGRNFSEGSIDTGGGGGGGGAGFTSPNNFGAGGGGGAGGSGNLSGGGGAGGANFIDTSLALEGANDNAGIGGVGGQGGLAGETSETSAIDRRGETGAPGQIVVTFYSDIPNS